MTPSDKRFIYGPIATAMDVIGTILPLPTAILAQFDFTHHQPKWGIGAVVVGSLLVIGRLVINDSLRGLCRSQDQLLDAYRQLVNK